MDTIADKDLWMPRSYTDSRCELSTVAPGVNVLLAKCMLWEGVGSANLEENDNFIWARTSVNPSVVGWLVSAIGGLKGFSLDTSAEFEKIVTGFDTCIRK